MWTTPLRCLISGQQESVLNVLNSDIMTGNQNSNHVEPICQFWGAVSIHPDAGAAAQFPALPKMNSLNRMTERFATSRLHFHERHFIAPSHDEVDIAMPAAETMRDERPSVAPHPSRGNTFAQQSECLSLLGHGRTLLRSPGTCVTRTARATLNERSARTISANVPRESVQGRR